MGLPTTTLLAWARGGRPQRGFLGERALRVRGVGPGAARRPATSSTRATVIAQNREILFGPRFARYRWSSHSGRCSRRREDPDPFERSFKDCFWLIGFFSLDRGGSRGIPVGPWKSPKPRRAWPWGASREPPGPPGLGPKNLKTSHPSRAPFQQNMDPYVDPTCILLWILYGSLCGSHMDPCRDPIQILT